LTLVVATVSEYPPTSRPYYMLLPAWAAKAVCHAQSPIGLVADFHVLSHPNVHESLTLYAPVEVIP